MKKYTLTLIGGIGLIAIGLVSFNSKGIITKYHSEIVLNSGGAPSGRTGAPGEVTCFSCHSDGTVQDGNQGVNVLELTAGGVDYTPGEINSMLLTFNDEANKNGFQLVVLNAADEMAGSLSVTDATNTRFITSAFLNREYITHTSTGTALNTWSFDWLAPESGGDVTFYVATNKTNSNSQSSGDVIYVSQHSFTSPDLVGLNEENEMSQKLNVGFEPSSKQLVLDFEVIASNELSLNVTDLSGKSVFFKNMGTYTNGSYSDKIFLNTLENGIYNVTLFIGNKPFTGKVFVQ